ncbi:MAG: zinc ribbon domain-containing protein [Clostridiales bacterium]|nr:zinc ribbon domain-containing protein [Clostridiales bacterium]MDY5515081.1 zinc ribbon domain-containing protein [Candidatus Ventricola sp.]
MTNEDLMKYPICQSCGMPLQTPDQLGKNADGTQNGDYCIYCCPDGPEHMRGTLEEMIDFCAPIEVRIGVCPDEQSAKEMLRAYLPTLKRWRKDGVSD